MAEVSSFINLRVFRNAHSKLSKGAPRKLGVRSEVMQQPILKNERDIPFQENTAQARGTKFLAEEVGLKEDHSVKGVDRSCALRTKASCYSASSNKY